MPITPEQLDRLQRAFRPHSPIEDPNAFFGRERERASVHEAITRPGLQVVVYGEPGCGKTSLVYVSTSEFQRVKVFCERDADFSRILRDIAWEFHSLNPQRRVYDAAQNTITFDGVSLPLEGMTPNNLLSILPKESPFCVILDELDRVQDRRAIKLLAELTKNVATKHPNLTFIMVGVAATTDQLLQGHTSNFRNLLQVPLGRMEEPELKAVLTRGEQVLGLTFSANVSDQIVSLCDRSPYYLHLLATASARAALDAGSPTVDMDDLAAGCRDAAAGADELLRETYELAILSNRGSRIYQRIIWGMANLAPKANNVADIRLEVNNIALTEADMPVTAQAVGGALRRLASADKRHIVHQPITGVYSFINPLMKGFIRLLRYRPCPGPAPS
jgi:hypothetical protein